MLARTAGFRAAGKRAARATASRTAGTSSSRWHSAAAGDGDGEAERKPFVPLGEVNKGGGGISADGSVDEDPTSAIFDDDPQIEAVLRANRQWVSAQNAKDPEYFDKLGQPQTPEFFYIGCSDARVPANQILGLGPGEVFVHRNVANQVIGTDLNMLACLQYAVEHLKVRHILVVGHYNCGGVLAAMQNNSLGTLNSWVERIRDVYRLHQSELDGIKSKDDRARRLIELNIMEQCLNVYKTDTVQRRRLETYLDRFEPTAYPKIHGLVFDPSKGKLDKLQINFKEEIARYQHIYDLYQPPHKGGKPGSWMTGDPASHYMLKKPAGPS